MRKAVATALVLIAGAAVVLWYGNTLNSWVLGGLIGGFAALLISIPISLTLFTYLSRRHDELAQSERTEDTLQAEMREYEEPHPVFVYREIPTPSRPLYIEEEEFYASGERAYWTEEYARPVNAQPPLRQLPAPRRQQPATSRSTRRLPRMPQTPGVTRKLTRELDTSRHPAITRRLGYPGFPGYQSKESRSRFHSRALRMAREEAAYGMPPTQSFSAYTREGQPIIDSSISPISPDSQEVTRDKISGRHVRYSPDPETEVPDTQPFTGNLQKPLVRRAPYMYEDDELKREFSGQIPPPITRRSSRKLPLSQDDV